MAKEGSHHGQTFLFHPVGYQNCHRDDLTAYFQACVSVELHSGLKPKFMEMSSEQKVSPIQSRIRENPEIEAHVWTSAPAPETTVVKTDH